jgi:hypothetical protein
VARREIFLVARAGGLGVGEKNEEVHGTVFSVIPAEREARELESILTVAIVDSGFASFARAPE